jgi:hypothetical protein
MSVFTATWLLPLVKLVPASILPFSCRQNDGLCVDISITSAGGMCKSVVSLTMVTSRPCVSVPGSLSNFPVTCSPFAIVTRVRAGDVREGVSVRIVQLARRIIPGGSRM